MKCFQSVCFKILLICIFSQFRYSASTDKKVDSSKKIYYSTIAHLLVKQSLRANSLLVLKNATVCGNLKVCGNINGTFILSNTCNCSAGMTGASGVTGAMGGTGSVGMTGSNGASGAPFNGLDSYAYIQSSNSITLSVPLVFNAFSYPSPTTTPSILNDWTLDTTTGIFTSPRSGVYAVSWIMTLDSSDANPIICTFRITLSGVEVPGSATSLQVTGNGTDANIGLSTGTAIIFYTANEPLIFEFAVDRLPVPPAAASATCLGFVIKQIT